MRVPLARTLDVAAGSLCQLSWARLTPPALGGARARMSGGKPLGCWQPLSCSKRPVALASPPLTHSLRLGAVPKVGGWTRHLGFS